MSLLTKLFGRSPNGAKLNQMQHGDRGSWIGSWLFQDTVGWNPETLPATNRDFGKLVGDGLGSSVLAGPLNWLMRNFAQAPPIVQRFQKDQWQTIPNHPLTALLRNPNPFYGGRVLWMATIFDYVWGDAFWLLIRNQSNKIVEIWWVPRGMITPKWPNDGKTFISHYEYNPGNGVLKLEPRDVVHFRHGIDPRNIRRGLSELGSLMREIYTDDQAANFSSAILQNLGIIGVLISPKEGLADSEDVQEIKDYLQKNFTGDKRGKALALSRPLDVKVMQYDLKGFDVAPLRDIAEERVTAALGIPAAVVGFGTGLQQTKVGATMREMRRVAWTDGIIPRQTAIAEDLDRALLPAFETRSARVQFDLTDVPALWEEENEKHDRVRKDVQAGIITVARAQDLLGYPVDDDRDVYLQPVNLIQLPDGQTMGVTPRQGDEDDDDDDDTA